MRKCIAIVLLLLVSGARAFAQNPNAANAMSSLSVSELKRLLAERGVDFRDCLEKRDLVERLASSGPVVKTAQQQLYTPEENLFVQTFKRVAPSVAYITTTVGRNRRFSLQDDQVPAGAGSGFLWDRHGHVVTNCHVVMSSGSVPKSVKVKLQGMAQAYDAEVVGVEPDKDLAVLKIPARNLPLQIDVGTSDDLQVGQKVLAIGNPFGLDNTLTTGVVSAIGRDVNGFGGRKIKGCVQTDAAINPGNSGGPLLDTRGRLIGVNTAIYTPTGGGNVGIGFAIPVDTVRRVVNQIIRYGKVVRPTLGIHVTEDRMVRSIEQQVGRSLQGVLVAEVLPNSPAEKAGLQGSSLRGDGTLQLGDLITHVDDQPVRQVEDLLSAIEEKKEGAMCTLTVQRGCSPNRTERIQARLVSRDVMRQQQSQPNTNGSRFGVNTRKPSNSAWQ